MNNQYLSRNPESSLFVSNLDLRVTEDILYELFIQVSPILSLFLPKNPISKQHKGFAFIEFKSQLEADYVLKVMHLIKLYSKPIKISKISGSNDVFEIGANLFVSKLNPETDENKLYQTFVQFGNLLNVKIIRDIETGKSLRYAYLSYDSFESSDKAIEAMNNKFFDNSLITVEYKYKNNSKKERHGDMAERLLASNRTINMRTRININGDEKEENNENKKFNIPENIKNILPPLPINN